MNLQSPQTCPNHLCVWYFPAKVSVLMWWIAQMFINTSPPCRTSVSTFTCGPDLKPRHGGKQVTELCDRGKNRPATWFCLANSQTVTSLSYVPALPYHRARDERRESARERRERAREERERERERWENVREKNWLKGKEKNGLITFRQSKKDQMDNLSRCSWFNRI